MPPLAPWPPVCSLTDPCYQQRTHTGSPAGRAHPNPDLHGMEHKKPPFLAREEPLCTSRLLCRPRGRLKLSGQACRPQEGSWAADSPLKGRVHDWLMEAAEMTMARPGRHQPPTTARLWLSHLLIRIAATSTQGMTRGRTTARRRVRAPDRAATKRRRLPHLEMLTMWGSQELLVAWCLVLAAGGTEHVYRPSRRVCAVGVSGGPILESFVQRVYQPFLTTCDGHRACSTYRTIYRTAYRHSPGPTPTRPHYACCPGWKRTNGLPGACGAAICQPPCGNGGSCIRPGHCRCPVGWQGDTCQIDVDECSTGEASCPQRCVNTVGSYWCECWEGQSLSVDGMRCLPKEGPSLVAPNPTAGVDSMVREEVHKLQSRVEVLEQKLQLVLAPLHSLASRATEHGLQDPGSLLAHSFQQLDRIDSLSEQVSFLEEQLGSCSCKKDL